MYVLYVATVVVVVLETIVIYYLSLDMGLSGEAVMVSSGWLAILLQSGFFFH